MAILSKQAIYAEHLIQNSMDFIGAADKDGAIIEYNPAALKAFGYTLEELRLLPYHELYASEEDYKRVSHALDTEGQFRGEILNRRKNGETFTCFLSANVILDDDGIVVGIMGISRDISREKELAHQLQIQNEKNAQLVEELGELSRIAINVVNGIVITDVDGRMKWSNESFSRLTGYSQEELIGLRPSELFRVPHFYEETFRELTKNGPNFDVPIQVPHYHKNGGLYWILVESTPVYDDNGQLIEIIEICTEITSQKRAELALIESESNFRQMSETIEDIFFLYNVIDREYEYISPNSEKMLGVGPEFFYNGGEFVNSFVDEEDRYSIRRGRLDILNGKPYDVEYRIQVKNTTKWIRERAYPVKGEDNDIIKASGIISDITRIKQDRELIDIQNRAIAESITYAQHIQDSTLQDEEDVQEVFPESFLYFLPKSELSGDFYIIDTITTNDGKKLPSFIIADCTGHGVPGAILSILCTSLVKQSLANRDVNSPADALDLIRRQLAKLFDGGASYQIMDGMDVGFGVINPEERQLTFSGANLTAHILRDGNWIELRGSKQHVGYTENPSPFENVTFDYKTNDQLYLFTDGFVDQFGGSQNKKYLKRKLMAFIESIADEPMNIQRDMIEMEFLEWKGNEEQTDDICCFGFKFD